MSMDFKVLECTTDNLDDENLDWKFLGYASIWNEDYDCFQKIYYDSDIPKRFKENSDGYSDFRVFDSTVYKKETLLELIEEYKCSLQIQLNIFIESSHFDYIVLQLF